MTDRPVTGREALATLVGVMVLFGLMLLPPGPVYWLRLTVGWFWYLQQTLPRVTVSPVEVIAAVAALVVLLVGAQQLGRWLSPPLLDRPWRWKWTGQAVGLLVLLFVAGTAAVGFTRHSLWLAQSGDWQQQYTGQEARGRIWLSNNFKQLGYAAAHHELEKHQLPVPTFTPDGRPLHSWHTFLLPYIEQEHLFRLMDLSKPWSDPANQKAVEQRINVFDHPFASLPGDGPKPAYLVPNVRLLDRPRRFTDADFPLGTANTILAGEAIRDARPWADPLNGRDARRPLGSPGGFAGVPDRPALVLMADGSVRTVSQAGWAAVMQGLLPGDD